MKCNLVGFVILILTSVALTVNAQNSTTGSYSVKGVLIDSISNEGEPYATIRIALKANPDKPVKLAVTDTNGKFVEKLTQAGTFLISFTSVGKTPVQREFTLSDAQKNVNLGNILISEATEMLKGVEVVAQKPLVKAEIDKVTYSVEDDPDSKTNSTLEMLRKVPLVTVDGEDKIQVNGSSNFKVHVNGKPNNMMSNNPTEVLKSLPANSVKSIEVITDPGAKYDAEGVGGILNIITTGGGGMEGYTVTLNGGVNDTGYNASGYGTVQIGKFTVTGNYSYNHQDRPRSYSTSGREDFTSDAYKFLSSESSYKSKSDFQFGSMEGSYEIDTLNLITFSMNLFGGEFKNNGQGSTFMQNAQHQHAYSYNTLSRNISAFSSIGANFDYQRSFKKKGEYLTFSYRFNGSPDNSEAYTEYEDIKDYPYSMDFLRNQYYDNDARSDEHTFQLDYTNPITKAHKVDAGVKYILRDNSSDSKYFKEFDGTYKQDEDLTSKYDQSQDILAAYADYQLKLGKFGAKAGLRFEHTRMDVEYAYLPERNFESSFNDLVPSASFTYQLADTKTIRANYNMRISRPGIWYLNPFRDTSNPTSISYGNPDLETEKAHSMGMTFSSFSQKFNMNLTFNYLFINNGIERYSFMNNGVQESTYGNIGKTQRARLSVWLNWNPGSKTRISLNGGGSYADFKSDSKELNVRNHGFQGDLFLNAQQTLPWDLRFSFYGGGSTPYISLQGKGSSYFYYGFGLSRSFLKENRLRVSINTSKPFSKYNTYSSETLTDTFRSWGESKSPERSFGFNISWRFGELKAQVKKTARSINNDDVKSGGSGSSGGGGTPSN